MRGCYAAPPPSCSFTTSAVLPLPAAVFAPVLLSREDVVQAIQSHDLGAELDRVVHNLRVEPGSLPGRPGVLPVHQRIVEPDSGAQLKVFQVAEFGAIATTDVEQAPV